MNIPHTSALVSMIRYYCCLLFIGATGVSAQQLSFSRLGVNDGLAQSSVYCIFQDKQGFLWFGSSDGLNRYDGIKLKTYKHTYAPSIKGSGNFYGSWAFEDEVGNIYFSGRTGISYYDKCADEVAHFFPLQDTARFNTMIDLLGLKNGVLWFTDCNSNVYAYHLVTKTMQRYPLKSPSGKPAFRRVKMDDQGRVWYSTGESLGCLNTKTGMYSFHLTDFFTSLHLSLYTNITFTGPHTFIMVAYYTIIEYDMRTGKYTFLVPVNKNESYSYFYKDPKGTSYITSMVSGLWVLKDQKLTHYPHLENYTESPASNIIISMAIDRSGNLWLGCDGYGVTRVNINCSNFSYYHKNLSPEFQKLETNFIKCFYAQGNEVWMGTHEGGLYRYHKVNRTLQKFKFTWNGSNVIAAIKPYKGKLLLGTGAGVLVFNPLTGKAQKTPIEQASTVTLIDGQNFVTDVLPADSIIYVATRQGLYYINTRKPFVLKSVNPGYKPFIVPLYLDHTNTLWSASIEYGHVLRYKLNQHLVPYMVDSFMYGTSVRSFYEDTLRGLMWMASEKGLVKYNLATGSEQTVTINDGLADNYLYSVVPGTANQLWLSSNKGLMCYDINTQKVQSYLASDGLQSNEFNTGCYHRSKEGELFFGGINGFNSFYPQHIKTNSIKPQLALTKLLINDDESITYGNACTIRDLVLPHNQNTISLEFAALEFTNPHRNEYAFLLEGIDKNWVNSGTQHAVRYSALAPGSYRFWIKASNNHGVWSNAVNLVNITITAPWYSQWWFLTFGSLVLIAGSVFLVHYFGTRKLKIQLQQINAVNEERNRISKDMHDDLGSGISKIAIMSQLLKSKLKEDSELKPQVEKIATTAHDLVDSMGQIVWAMNTGNDTLENFLAYVREYVNDFADDTHLNCRVCFEEVSASVNMSQRVRRNIFLVIKEVLNNALKHADAKLVEILFTSDKHLAKLVIADNGKGFEVNSTRKFGNGLVNMRKRLAEVNADFTLVSSPGKGTRIIITWSLVNTQFM